MELLYIKAAFVFVSLITFILITNPVAIKKLAILVIKKNFSANNVQQIKK